MADDDYRKGMTPDEYADWEGSWRRHTAQWLEQVDAIEDLSTGRYVLTTLSGTKHFVDLDARTAIRMAVSGHEWSAFSGGRGEITPDGAEMRFWTIKGYDLETGEYSDSISVGQHMRLDNRDEWRITTQIQSIEKVLAEQS